MKINNPILSDDEIISIVSGISEIADDIETQRFLIKNYIETETKGEMLAKSEEELEKSAKQYAESVLSKRISELEQDNKTNEKKLSSADEKIKEQDLQINHLAESVERMQLNIQNSSKLNKHRENEIIELKKANLKKWKILKIATFVSVGLFMLYLTSLMFWQKDWEYNIMWRIIQLIDNQKESSTFSIGQTIVGLPLYVFWYCIKMVWDAWNATIQHKCNFWSKSSLLPE